jgi:hypothetical protein
MKPAIPNHAVIITRPQGTPFPIHQEPRQPHGQLGEQVVVRDRERELEPVPKQCVFHRFIPSKLGVK